MQKGIFYRVKAHLLFSIYESLLQPSECPFPFHNKRVSLPLHYYNNTIKTTVFQFPCHSCHSSLCHNILITSRLHEMLKVTATKNKNYVRFFRVTMEHLVYSLVQVITSPLVNTKNIVWVRIQLALLLKAIKRSFSSQHISQVVLVESFVTSVGLLLHRRYND